MTPEQEADIRALHIEYWASDDPDDMRCEDCDDPWPCDADILQEALDEARAERDNLRLANDGLADVLDERDAALDERDAARAELAEARADVERLRQGNTDLLRITAAEVDAARADFNRLQDFVADADAAILDAFWFTEHNTPDAITARNAALAAHEAQKEGA